MWILSSLGRPDRIRKVVESYVWGDESLVLLTLWQDDPRLQEYLEQMWPRSWSIEIVPMRGNGPTYNEILRRYPNEPHYGFLADDAILDVMGMLRKLEQDAGGWNVAYANDQYHQDRICTMPCIGGDLVRAVGYLSPPDFMHMGIDCVWHEIGRTLGVLRYHAELTYTHAHPLLGLAAVDETYLQAQLLSVGHEQAFRGWKMGGELDAIKRRVTARSSSLGEHYGH